MFGLMEKKENLNKYQSKYIVYSKPGAQTINKILAHM